MNSFLKGLVLGAALFVGANSRHWTGWRRHCAKSAIEKLCVCRGSELIWPLLTQFHLLGVIPQ